jgi:hemoglobin
MDLQVRPRHRDLDDDVEIAEMVRRFYAEVAQDDLLGPVFINVAHVDWPEHLAELAAFWCRVLLEQRARKVALVHSARLVGASVELTPWEARCR